MNLKIYERTRYQNIYRHKKNKNYVIMISKPVKSSISKINDRKIFTLEEALKIRDNPKVRLQKSAEIKCSSNFDELWDKYTNHCKYELKLAYNTMNMKEKLYSKYLKSKITEKVPKITKDYMAVFIDKLDCSDKQKNQIIKVLRAFFNYLVKEEIIISSPVINIKKYKVGKIEMKFWTPEEVKKILEIINCDINSNDFSAKNKAYRTKILIMISFSLGDRIGETRALTFDSFKKDLGTVEIRHSINYDPNSDNFLSTTKTYHSQRELDVTDKLISEIENYKNFVIEELGCKVKDNDLIFFNYSTDKPYSDVTLRKGFYYYCDKAEVPRIRMYDLRHTYVATMMAEGKELYHISRRLGHTNYSTTVNEYGHLSKKARKEIAKITDKYI